MEQKKAASYLVYIIFGLFSLLFVPFWTTIIIAGIFALALQPVLRKGSHKNIPHKFVIIATVLTSLIIITPVTLGVYSISTKLVEYAKTTTNKNTENNLSLMFDKKITKLAATVGIPKTKQLSRMTQKFSSTMGDKATSWATTMMANLPDIVINVIVFTLVLYLMLNYQVYIKKQIQSWKILTNKDLDEFIDVLQKSSNQCLVSLLIVGAVQAGVVLIGSLIAGYSSPLFVFLITFVFSFIPIIGAAPVAFFLSLMSLGDGDTTMGIFLFIVGCFAGTIDNILKPLLVKRGIDMDGFLMLIAIIGAIIVFGLPGLFIGPIIATTAAYYFHKNNKIEIEPEEKAVLDK